MTTTRPATPPAAERRLLVVPAVGVGVMDEVVLADPVVARVVPGVVAAEEVFEVASAAVEAVRPLEVPAGSVTVGPVDLVPAAGRCGESVRVVGPTVVGPAVVGGAAVVVVSGNSVRVADGVVEPSSGTVTSGTVLAATGAPEPAVGLPATRRPVLPGVGAGVAGEDCSAAPPQAASSTAAMP